jgi:L-threonylcarbamoyladenylate synthase
MALGEDVYSEQCRQVLLNGEIAVIPTDTVYGVVCRAADKRAVIRLYALKSRQHKPGTIIASSIEQLVELGVKRRYLKAVEHFWPNSISIEIPHDIDYLNQRTGRQAFRVVKDPALASLLELTGPLLTSSANQPGKSPANTIKEAKDYFGDKVDYYEDGGDLSGRESSTIIKIDDDAVSVIREGAVKISEAGEIVNES